METESDIIYMRRAIDLARNGLQYASPNPMVGAVIVADDGRIIGEGYHRRCGEAHAEVNAVASVADRDALRRATIYVTLEPCAHYGKTPPCALLLTQCGFRRVVVGAVDPFAKVAGRGIAMLRQAGIEVTTGVLEQECRDINPVFFTAHTLRRPWVTLKWAQSADGFIDRRRQPDEPASRLSSPLTTMLVHRLRTLHDAILTGSGTALADRPQLTSRLWPGRQPLRVIADRRRRIAPGLAEGFVILGNAGSTPADYLADLYGRGVTSVLVEGGRELLQSFIDAGCYDAVRVETAPVCLTDGIKAPVLNATPTATEIVDGRRIDSYGHLPWYWR